MRRFLALAAVVLVALAAAPLLLLVAMRTKSRVLLSVVRRVNRALLNPRQMRSAGTPGAYASVIHHVGRTSGRRYGTPVGAVRTDDGFVIALPYGTQADWVRNTLAAGSATIVDDGGTYEVERPELVAMDDALHWFGERDRRSFGLFRVEQCLRVRLASPGPQSPSPMSKA